MAISRSFVKLPEIIFQMAQVSSPGHMEGGAPGR